MGYAPPPDPGFDGTTAVDITTADGTRLVAELREPLGAARGTVILAPAMMASARTLARGLAPFLVARSHRVVLFDFRGHGGSGTPAAKGGDWSYDALVREDLAAVSAATRARFEGPLSLVGHSLGGHVAIAAAGLGLAPLDAIVLLAANVWLPRFEPSLRMRAAKRAILEGCAATARRVGYLPVRRLGLGSDDESRSYFAAFLRYWQDDRWTSDDGRDDYSAAAARVKVPVLAIASEGDRLACAPPAAERFAALVGSRDRTFEVLRGADAPGHMALVTKSTSAPAWERLARWLEGRLRE